MFPISNCPEHLFRSVFSSKGGVNPINQTNFLAKNYRFKCDECSKLCGLSFYVEKHSQEEDYLKKTIVICEQCYNENKVPKSINKENLQVSNFYSVVNPRESKCVLI